MIDMKPFIVTMWLLVFISAVFAIPLRRKRQMSPSEKISSNPSSEILKALTEILKIRGNKNQRPLNDYLLRSLILKQMPNKSLSPKRATGFEKNYFRYPASEPDTQENMIASKLISMPQRRKFPEVDSRGFDEDIFDEGFGDFSPMKRCIYSQSSEILNKSLNLLYISMDSEEEEEIKCKVKGRKNPILYSDDSDSDSKPITHRRCRSDRVYVSDSEINSTSQRNCGNLHASDEDNVTRSKVWSEGDEGAVESENSSTDDESGNENEAPRDDDSSTSSDSDSGPDGTSEMCPICLRKFKNQEIGTPESCDHTFCLECIEEWSKKVTTCPIDRQKFSLILVRAKIDSEIIRRVSIYE
ncbi:PHD and RING finger domain-containing protein 1 [Nymphon striatum]|nr:PHD and RING finger domain-containing protein 1 [Nymphon striatum]